MQGFNMGRYHAPSSLDTSLDTPRAKRQRTSTDKPSAPTIRFEMPFPIWCSTCPSSSTSCLIGQGVRFNALKTKVGNYYSTPIWQFRMKHTACGGWIEIRTDPANSEFVVTEGARRRETGDDARVAERIGGVLVGGDEAEKERRRNDAFAALEGKKEEKERVKGEARRLDSLKSMKERDWRDPDAANKRLRDAFRPGRRARAKDKEGVDALKERIGFGIDIVEEDEGDKRRAGFIEFGSIGGKENTAGKPLFRSVNGMVRRASADGDGKLLTLRNELSGNTRASLNPFAQNVTEGTSTKDRLLPGVKRRKEDGSTWALPTASRDTRNDLQGKDVKKAEQLKESASNAALVSYDSE